MGSRLSAIAIESGMKDEIDKQLGLIILLLFFIVAKLCALQKCAERFVLHEGRRLSCPVLILSYETFRLHAAVLHKGSADLIICDEVCELCTGRKCSLIFSLLI